MCCQFETARRLYHAKIRRALLDRHQLTDEQANYIGVAKQGPYKPEHYRY